MERPIVAFTQDRLRDWVAHLECGHRVHVRHKPPWQVRAWVTTEQGRREHIGSTLDCLRCDRRELPDGFTPYKRTATFDQNSIPAGLRARHTVKRGVWGAIHVLSGQLRYRVHGTAPGETLLGAGDVGFIAPQVPHDVTPVGEVRFFVEFYAPRRDDGDEKP